MDFNISVSRDIFHGTCRLNDLNEGKSVRIAKTVDIPLVTVTLQDIGSAFANNGNADKIVLDCLFVDMHSSTIKEDVIACSKDYSKALELADDCGITSGLLVIIDTILYEGVTSNFQNVFRGAVISWEKIINTVKYSLGYYDEYEVNSIIFNNYPDIKDYRTAENTELASSILAAFSKPLGGYIKRDRVIDLYLLNKNIAEA